jgi:antitoxin VapB
VERVKVERNGDEQSIRLPEAYRFPGHMVFVKKIGNAVALLPADQPWESLAESLAQFSDDFLKERDQPSWRS